MTMLGVYLGFRDIKNDLRIKLVSAEQREQLNMGVM